MTASQCKRENDAEQRAPSYRSVLLLDGRECGPCGGIGVDYLLDCDCGLVQGVLDSGGSVAVDTDRVRMRYVDDAEVDEHGVAVDDADAVHALIDTGLALEHRDRAGQPNVQVLMQQDQPVRVGGRCKVEPGDRGGAIAGREPGDERLQGGLVEVTRSNVGLAAVGKDPRCLTVAVLEDRDVDLRAVDDGRMIIGEVAIAGE